MSAVSIWSRDHDGQFYVLEDNLRCPSGVSYVLGNRRVMKQTWPAVFEALSIRPVDDYAGRLAETLRHLIPESILETQHRNSHSLAFTTLLILNTRFWLSKWEKSWSKARTLWLWTTLST